MNRKLIYYSFLSIGIFLGTFFIITPLDNIVENQYKLSFYGSFVLPLFAYIAKYYFSFFRNKKWKVIFIYLFIINFFIGIGFVFKYVIFYRISYLGLISIVFSFMFLILGLSLKKDNG